MTARKLDGSDGADGSPLVPVHSVASPPPSEPPVAPPSVAVPSAGDSATFEAVWAEHFDFVWRALRALGVRPGAIDDAVQDVFMIVHDRMGAYDGRSPMRAWLFGIARNVARRHHAQAARVSPLALVHAPAPLDEAVHWRERAAWVARFLDGLDEGQREVFVMAQLAGSTAPEIAAALDLNLNTVYSRLRTSRALFERALARQDLRDRRGER